MLLHELDEGFISAVSKRNSAVMQHDQSVETGGAFLLTGNYRRCSTHVHGLEQMNGSCRSGAME